MAPGRNQTAAPPASVSGQGDTPLSAFERDTPLMATASWSAHWSQNSVPLGMPGGMTKGRVTVPVELVVMNTGLRKGQGLRQPPLKGMNALVVERNKPARALGAAREWKLIGRECGLPGLAETLMTRSPRERRSRGGDG
ncbi:MAG: hypothetical protein ACI9EF_003195 [Pseudohongiellaceae bacterium]|jgi:hypothetical protein